MNASPPSHAIDPAKLLPSDWNKACDVLLIVGEGAGSIAQPFVAYGLERVITMYPDGMEAEPGPETAQMARSRSELSSIVNLYPQPHPNRYATIRTPACTLPMDTTNGIKDLLQNLVKRKGSNQANVERLAPLWAINATKNLVAMNKNPLISDVGNAFANVPLIIVGAGPSLAKNIDQLKSAQDKAIILCVNRALRSLYNAGIVPDLTINLEPQDVAAQFEGVGLEKLSGILLASSSHPPLYQLPAQRILSFCPNQITEGWMFPPSVPQHEVSSGGSVSCSALSVGLFWKCSPIILVGQDLSFPGGAYYHSGGADGDAKAVYDEAKQEWILQGYSPDLAHTLADKVDADGIRFSGTTVPGYFGGTVPTSTDFAAFRAWFESTALDHGRHTSLFNCTEGGAFIGGMKHVPLSTVLSQLPEKSIAVDAVLKQITVPMNRVDWATQCRINLVRDLKKAEELTSRLVVMAPKAARKPGLLRLFDQTQAEVRPILRRLPPVNLMTQKGIRSAIAEAQNARTIKQTMRANQNLYTVVRAACRKLLEAASD